MPQASPLPEPDADALAQVPDELGGMAGILGIHLRLASGTVYRHFSESMAELALTQKQVAMLWLVEEHPGMAQTDLAHRLHMDRATTMAVVNRLEARGLLARAKSPTDGRKQALQLTPSGQATLAEARQVMVGHERWVKSRFTPGEVSLLLELLRRLHG